MECLSPIYIHKNDVIVPCGKCPFCAVTKRSDWATRLMYESKQHFVKKFVTLTYADCHLRWDKGNSQLEKRDLQLWFKRIRKLGYKVRYFAVGEYGSRTYRPHYHVILFGDVPDEVLQDCWRDEVKYTNQVLGHVHIGTVTEASVMYCLGYLVNAKGWQMKKDRVPPFSLMSRKPGLGANYLSPEMMEWHHSDRRNYVLVDGAKRHLPRYYKGKIFSKIDHVRIAVYSQNAAFKRDVEWLRSPEMMRVKDPVALRREQRRRLAMKIRATSKNNLMI